MEEQFYTIGHRHVRPLTAQEEVFVAEYLACLDPMKAALRAGYSRSTLKNVRDWLKPHGKKPGVYRAVQQGLQARMNRLNITGDAILGELYKLGFSNMANYIRFDSAHQPQIDLSSISANDAAAIKSITVEEFKEGKGKDARDVRRVKLELHDKKAPLIALAKHAGLLDGQGGPGQAADDGAPVAPGGQVPEQAVIQQFNIAFIPAGNFVKDGQIIDHETAKKLITMQPDENEDD